MKQSIYYLIDGKKGNHRVDAYVDIFISVLILLNLAAVFVESYEPISKQYNRYFRGFEIFSIVVFSIEYGLRIWTADLLFPHLSKFKARFKFIFSFFGLIDLFAILPFFLPLLIKMDIRIIRTLRLLRLLRIFKLDRHSKSLKIVGDVLRETKYDLLITVVVAVILLLIVSTLIFNIEHAAQPNAFENIGQSLWWAVATLTTVGYVDIYPITILGKFLSGIIALLGIGIVALPTGIISSAFVEKIQDRKQLKSSKQCPHCKKLL